MKTQRRKFLEQLLAASLVGVTLPALGKEDFPVRTNEGDEAFWEGIRKQFAPGEKLIMINAANLCPSPSIVNDLMVNAKNIARPSRAILKLVALHLHLYSKGSLSP